MQPQKGIEKKQAIVEPSPGSVNRSAGSGPDGGAALAYTDCS
jgi:hypothetical protein